MPLADTSSLTQVTSIAIDGHTVRVAVRVGYDGVEHVGRLWFTDPVSDEAATPDRGAISGRTQAEVFERASELSAEDLTKRYRRAMADKRRFTRLRKTTDELIAKVRYLNQVAIAMRAGMLDIDGAAQEIDLTERQMHELVDDMRGLAGVED